MFTNEQDEIAQAATEYIDASPFAFLATSYGGKPFIRTVAPFAIKGMDVYFSAMKKSAKVTQIQENPSVTVLFQHENQDKAKFKNVTLFGRAFVLDKESDQLKAAKLLGEKEPWFKSVSQTGELANIALIKVIPEKLQYLDFERGRGANALVELKIDRDSDL